MIKMLVAATAASALLTGCAGAATPSTPASVAACTVPPAANLATSEGWIGFAAAHKESVAFSFDDGRGTVASHRADRDQPLASAVKVVHLAAYAQAVTAGTLDPDEQIPIIDWQRWYAPGTDGGAHIAALDRLGIANDGTSPLDPAATVRLDDMVTAMVRESDNGVPDYLRHRLGDDSLRKAAAAGGWRDFDPPTLVGTALGALDARVDTDRLWNLAEDFAFDMQFRASFGVDAPQRDESDLFGYFDTVGPRGSASELTAFYTSIADGSFGPGVDIVRRQLEHQQPPEGFVAMGFKGGNLPGILTNAFEFRRADGSPAVAVWLNRELTEPQYRSALENLRDHQALLLEAVADPATLERLACVS
ncbi:MAG: serine hydrolase [Rhodococcus sp. (in: high G+C Gram-positive bacteria)]